MFYFVLRKGDKNKERRDIRGFNIREDRREVGVHSEQVTLHLKKSFLNKEYDVTEPQEWTVCSSIRLQGVDFHSKVHPDN